ncbi:MAG: lycopene cyclase domain-containing protein [Minisyncoccia bacterium]
MPSYPLWLLLYAVLPNVLVWMFWYKTLRPHVRVVGVTILGGLLVGVPWDYLSIRDGIWTFPPENTIGWWAIGLPIEEWLFIILVTLLFASVTILAYEKYGTR